MSKFQTSGAAAIVAIGVLSGCSGTERPAPPIHGELAQGDEYIANLPPVPLRAGKVAVLAVNIAGVERPVSQTEVAGHLPEVKGALDAIQRGKLEPNVRNKPTLHSGITIKVEKEVLADRCADEETEDAFDTAVLDQIAKVRKRAGLLGSNVLAYANVTSCTKSKAIPNPVYGVASYKNSVAFIPRHQQASAIQEENTVSHEITHMNGLREHANKGNCPKVYLPFWGNNEDCWAKEAIEEYGDPHSMMGAVRKVRSRDPYTGQEMLEMRALKPEQVVFPVHNYKQLEKTDAIYDVTLDSLLAPGDGPKILAIGDLRLELSTDESPCHADQKSCRDAVPVSELKSPLTVKLYHVTSEVYSDEDYLEKYGKNPRVRQSLLLDLHAGVDPDDVSYHDGAGVERITQEPELIGGDDYRVELLGLEDRGEGIGTVRLRYTAFRTKPFKN